MSENIITQVSQETYSHVPQQAYEDVDNIDYDSRIHLNIRGQSFTITRDELMSLPESILLCLFPNGVFLDCNGQVITNLTEDDIVYVNFEPECFQYIINTFGQAQRDLQEMPVSLQVSGFGRFTQQETGANVLQSKPAIIVLREDLDYYVIPPILGLNAEQIRQIKLQVSATLTKNKLIFSGLGYDSTLPPTVDQTLGPAEQHLFDMLCTSGFESGGSWGSRSAEPNKCVILSLLLVRLRSEEPTPPNSPSLDPIPSETSPASRKSRSRIANLASSASRAASRSISKTRKNSNTNQTKLLLFWRKPARKCWWSNQTIDVDVSNILNNNQEILTIKVHIRRVWTLELSVIGVQ